MLATAVNMVEERRHRMTQTNLDTAGIVSPARSSGVRAWLSVLIMVLSALSAWAQQLDRTQYLDLCARRSQLVVQHFDTARNSGISGAIVRYAQNRDLAAADSLLLTSDQVRNPKGDMFWMYVVIGAALHGQGKMGPDAAAAMRNAWKTYAPYRGDTENHWCMYYSSLLLASELWPGMDGAEWYNGKSSAENFADAKSYLLHWITLTTSIGQGEFDSPTYLPEYVISMLLLAQFARDREIKVKAGMMLDYLFLDFALDHLDGMYLGAHSREGVSSVYLPRTAAATDFAWLYFGEGERFQSGWLLLPAVASYRLPDIIYRVATDRSATYISRERKRVRNVIRHGTEKNPPVYKYSYVTADYGLSSLQGGILQPIQQHTWSVRYKDGAPTSTIFGIHPYWSGQELATFFPEEEKVLIADVVGSKATYNKETKWTGGSPYEHVFQDRNTLLALYDIPPGVTSQHIDAFFPKNLDQRIIDSTGWIFCKAGSTFVAWYPLQQGEWMALPEDEGNHRFRSHEPKNGYVVEVRSAREAGNFESFCAKCRRSIPRFRTDAQHPALDYSTIDGRRLSFIYPDTRLVNGAPVRYEAWRLFDSPFARSELNSRMLTITYKGKRRVLDFNAGTVTGD
jgi:hypothetical protein